ncbi:transcriptional regulator RutR [Klebsiella pneumoniae]|uniref:Transcriptional regulator RutR n=1 Tax=Klebsiella pneumoniae TaxID=573 RepID=A0A378F6M5_KLEPN|nr:transcriptional regulator RutR [Klebsiella pneumoniae]
MAVLQQILAIWLAPLKAFREDISPLVAIREYIRLKLEVSRDHPQASKLFCLEMLQGAPAADGRTDRGSESAGRRKIGDSLRWIDRGKLAPVDPQHLIFMIWATTQHYADFATRWRRSPAPRCRMRPFLNKRSIMSSG